MAASREPFNVTPHSAAPAQMLQQHSPWHSPVPYLFGGLAAMLGLIAFALLILACSYWKLSGYLDGGDGNNRETDLEAGEGKGDDAQKRPPTVFEEKILVIMAGEIKPTYLATPMSSRSSSFGDTKSNSSSSSSSSSSSCNEDKKIEKSTMKGEDEDEEVHRSSSSISSSSSRDENREIHVSSSEQSH